MARILAVDDNRDNFDLMHYPLCAFGHDALTAADGATGIALARREQPDPVVSDIHTPGTIRADAAPHETPVPAVTALTMERGLRAGFDGYLAKPIGPQTSVEQAEGVLPADRRGCMPPRHEAAADATPVGRAPPPRLGTVLVVDDSASNRERVCQILQPVGYEVRVAAGVRQALRMALESVPDLLITDLHMPGEDGFDPVREMKANPHLARVPVIVVTSPAWGERHRLAALNHGAARLLVCPVEPQRLVDEVARCIRKGGANGDDPGR